MAAQQPDTSAFDVEPIFVEVLASMAAPYNPRKISDHDLAALRRSMTEFGCVEPIVCNRRTGRIVGGHQRVKAAQAEGIRHLPVCWVDLDEHRERALNLALNRIRGAWDDDALSEVLSFLDDVDFDLELTGFEDLELARLLQKQTDGATSGDAIPIEVPKRCNPGDLWQLGDHVLLCGDATAAVDVARLLAGAQIDLICTDPPYGIALDTDYQKMPKTTRGFPRIIGDDSPFDASPLRERFTVVQDQFWFGADYYATSLGDTSFAGSWLVWDKRVDENYDRGFGSCFELIWSARRRKRDILRFQWFQNHASDPVEAANRLHPTQKPTDLLCFLIDTSTGAGDAVADFFAGSGSTLIACEKLSRKCYALEIAPEYCDVILQRWENFTERKAERADA